MSILIGLALGVLILAAVAFFALRAGDKPMRRRKGPPGFDGAYLTAIECDHAHPGDSGSGDAPAG